MVFEWEESQFSACSGASVHLLSLLYESCFSEVKEVCKELYTASERLTVRKKGVLGFTLAGRVIFLTDVYLADTTAYFAQAK